MEEFITLSETQAESENSWCVNVSDIEKTSWDLTANNPNKKDTSDKRTPEQILAEIEELDIEASTAIAAIKELL